MVLALPVIERVKRVNATASVVCYGLYAPLNAELLRSLNAKKATVILSGLATKSEAWAMINPLIGNISGVRFFSLLDQVIR